MTTHQVAGGTDAPIAATLMTPPWARAETPQGRSQVESSRTADREARTTSTRTTPRQVSAVPVPPPRRRLPMSRDPHSPVPARSEPPSTPSTGLPSEAPLLSVHAAVVFLAAVIIGLIMGGLMFLHEKSFPAAV